MLPFSPTLASDGTIKYLALTQGFTPAQGPTVAYPDPSSGVVVVANIQPHRVAREVADGIVRYTTEYIVSLLNDPSTLNGGKGVRRDDAFWWSLLGTGRYLIAQGDPDPLRTVWRVRCVAYE